MDAIIVEAENDPQGWLADIASRAELKETLCGEGSMVWRQWGEGTPIILLHGGHGSWNHWCRNVEILAKSRFRVLAADLPGLGDSSDVGPPYTADRIADIVHYGITRLTECDEPVHIIGFSFGSVIGSVVAEKLGPQLASFNMVGGAGFGPRERVSNAMKRIRFDLELDVQREAAQNNMKWLMLADPKNVGKLATHIQIVNSARARTVSRPISLTNRLIEALPNILGPINAIWGSLDRTTLDTLDQRINILLDERPDAKVDILEGIGHWTQFEGAERYNELVLKMIAQ